MKTIAIVSFIDVENYGANLQALALQEELKFLGFNPTYINYSHKTSLKGLKKIKNRIWSIIRLFLGYNQRLRKTRIFRRTFFSLSTKIVNYEDLRNLNKFDYYLVGSDQVWIPRLLSVSHGFYFLDFAPINSIKISYASSFGTTTIPNDLDSIYFDNLKGFSSISVREKQGAEYLKKIGLESSVVLDPTFLLKTNDWLKYFNTKSKHKKPYILCYVMTGDHLGAKFINKFSKELTNVYSQYDILVIGDKEYKKLLPNYNLITNAGPDDFLNYIYNASIVITNSYHGTCFSLIFEKQFIVALNSNNPLNSRITNLLQLTNLSERLLFTNQPIEVNKFSKIDFSVHNQLIDKLRDESINYLKNVFTN